MKVTPHQRDQLLRYFAFTEFSRSLPLDVAQCHSREEIQIGSREAYQNDAVLHGRVDVAVNAVIKIMEDEE